MQDGNLMEENHQHFDYQFSMTINFPGSPHRMGFDAYSYAMGYRMEYSCISREMNYTIGYYGSPLFWEKYGYQFHGSPRKTCFAVFSLAMGY